MGQLTRVETVETMQVADVGLLQLPGCTFSETGLMLAPGLPFETWMQVGSVLCRSERAVRWWIGDWLAYGEHQYGEKYAQGEAITGIDEKTLQNYHFVSQNIQNSRRREKLSWSHHREVAGLPPAKQDELLKQAEQEKAGKLALRRWVKEGKLIAVEKITEAEPVKIDFARVRVRWKELVFHMEQFKADFPQFERHVNGWIAEMNEELDDPVSSGVLFVEQLIEQGTWEIEGLVAATKYTKATVVRLCENLVEQGSHEWRDKGGETEAARGARTKYIAPKSAPRGDAFEIYKGDRMTLIVEDDD